MSNKVIVPPGISGKNPVYNSRDVTLETVANELALMNLGDFEPLNFKIDTNQFMDEIQQFNNEWVDYLPRKEWPNNRQSLSLTNLPNKSHRENVSQAEASYDAGRLVEETEFNSPTDVYHTCHSLQPLLQEFNPIGRTFLIKSNVGGFFVPHRDHPTMPRKTFRIAVFLNNCAPLQYDWLMDTDRKLPIEMGRAYYINTRKTHRTISWVNDSIHLIMNIPFTSENVAKVFSNLQHRH
jgi:hypothetical protein